MALLGGEVLLALVVGALLILGSILVWRRIRTNNAWRKGLAEPTLRESVQRAVKAYRAHLGEWPKGKSEIERGLDASEETVKLAGDWDCRLITSSRDGRKARYSILIAGSWTDWDAHSAAPPRGKHSKATGIVGGPEDPPTKERLRRSERSG